MPNPFANPKFRASVYALAAAVFAVLGIYGVVTSEQMSAWLAVVSALVAVLALVNVPGVRKPQDGE